MTPIFPNLPTNLGVYTLTRLLGTHETHDRYVARQSHVDRSVIIEVLRPDCPKEILDKFLRNARARVAATLPNVSQMLESMVSKNIWYITLECPEGTPLSQLEAEGKRLSTLQACNVLEQAAQLYDLCARKGIAAGPLDKDMVFVKNETVAFISPVRAGKHNASMHPGQLDGLVAAMQNVCPEGEAGQTRVATLIQWMGQEFDGQRVEWQAVSATAEYIREQVKPLLTQEKVAVAVPESPATRKRRALRRKRAIIKIGVFSAIGLIVAAGIASAGLFIGPNIKLPPLPAVQDDFVLCHVKEGDVAVMSRPVSLREYMIFLEEYDRMTHPKRAAVNKGLPPSEADHTPLDWRKQYEAADNGKRWNNMEMTYDSPVRGISYWDAMAYANYRRAEIPSLHLLHSVRKAVGAPRLEEWTNTTRNAGAIYSKAMIVLPAEGGNTPILEADYGKRDANRTFRLILPSIPRIES